MNIPFDKNWLLYEAPLTWGIGEAAAILSSISPLADDGSGGNGWLKTCLPCDVHMPLIENGVIKDPVKANYCFDSEWIEKRSWWFLRYINSDEIDKNCDLIELEIDSLDSEADVFFNGVHLGSHHSAHYPFRHDIKPYITEGINSLLVRVTSGLEHVWSRIWQNSAGPSAVNPTVTVLSAGAINGGRISANPSMFTDGIGARALLQSAL